MTPGQRAPRRAGRQTTTQAIILKRRDFRESSRIVTCITREHGKITGLAKGAHRPDSPMLGRIDFLNEVDATFSADRGGLRLLTRAKLTRERRALRQPRRFLAAGHVAWLVDVACDEGRPDPALFDLLLGGLNLLERCPLRAIPQVVIGIEVRHLDALGALPDLDHCAECGCELGDAAYRQADTLGLACRAHAGLPRQPVPPRSLRLLRALRSTSGRDWPALDTEDAVAQTAPLPARWLAAALEQRAPYRSLIFPGRGAQRAESAARARL
ncbi:MAG: DNA repair protein RecO [Planctomycetota bacterium]|nr:DNA repair protein RecO [Planctomycetota bacterium]